MTSYINVISDSSERLFDGSEEYISLSPEMKELEIKLNHFRSESIKNKKLAEENEKKKEGEKLSKALRNLDNYDGTPTSQEEI